jgi:hypothetical protein
MFKRKVIAASIAAVLSSPLFTYAASNPELQELREEFRQMRQAYESRIRSLEIRLQKAEAAAKQAQDKARQADSNATEAVAAATKPPPASMNAFNPAISVILSGTFSSQSQDPEDFQITGFVPSGDEVGPGLRGFSLGESELNIEANADPYLYGRLTTAVVSEEDSDEIEVEEAFFQTTSLPFGFSLKGGRFFSGIGYLNEIHAHVWDFVDAPLAYQAFLGGQLSDDGVQLRWLAPTDLFLEWGGELTRGRNFPGDDPDKNGVGLYTVFAHAGGDVGVSHSWRAGLSYLHTDPHDREYDTTDLTGTEVVNSFDGDSDLWLADFVWKYAPNGNPSYTNFKLQSEYFYRDEDGDLTYDLGAASLGPNTGRYDSKQSGWYLQGVYQFLPRWRMGLRYDQLYDGSLNLGSNAANLPDPNYDPYKWSFMVDYNPSEFSRFRLQYNQDRSQEDVTDNEVFLQYIMSLGAHGTHKF